MLTTMKKKRKTVGLNEQGAGDLKKRRTVDLPLELSAALESLAKRDGMSVAAKMVEALRGYADGEESISRKASLNTFQFWIAQSEIKTIAAILRAIASRLDLIQAGQNNNQSPSYIEQYIRLNDLDSLVERSGIEPSRLGAIANGDFPTNCEISSLINSGLNPELIKEEIEWKQRNR